VLLQSTVIILSAPVYLASALSSLWLGLCNRTAKQVLAGQKTFYAVVFAAQCLYCAYHGELLLWMVILSRACHTNIPPCSPSVRCQAKWCGQIQLLEMNETKWLQSHTVPAITYCVWKTEDFMRSRTRRESHCGKKARSEWNFHQRLEKKESSFSTM
jgi:hypothetical protein